MRRSDHTRKLRENYAKLTPEQQRGMGYGTITKAEAGGKPKASPPPMKPKLKPMSEREKASSKDLEQMKIKAEARATPEGDLLYTKEYTHPEAYYTQKGIGKRSPRERKETAMEQYDKLPRKQQKNMGPGTKYVAANPAEMPKKSVKNRLKAALGIRS